MRLDDITTRVITQAKRQAVEVVIWRSLAFTFAGSTIGALLGGKEGAAFGAGVGAGGAVLWIILNNERK